MKVIQASGKGEILIVDDNPENLKLLTTILTENGFYVRASESFYILDFNGAIIETKQHACKSIGYTREEILRLKQILNNLIGNAVKFTHDGGIKVIAEKIGALEDNSKIDLRIIVEDTGIGIPEKSQKKIFDPFFTTKGKTGDTGLGLSIARGIVEEHGGKINMSSTIGKGTIFMLTFPVIQEN